MIKAIFFDLGGVIIRTENTRARAALGLRFGMTDAEIDHFVFDYAVSHQAFTGQMTEEQLWQAVARQLGAPEGEWPSIAADFFGGNRIDRDLLAWIESLRPAIKTGLLSNAWSGLRAYMQAEGFLETFEAVIISAEVGLMKPDERIYRLALEALALQPEEAIFVDDMPENIAACEAIGMKGVRFRNVEQVMADIKKLLAG
jgi:epoxide hydrolase-like predicted phosphatase